jgi:hypothetical protein
MTDFLTLADGRTMRFSAPQGILHVAVDDDDPMPCTIPVLHADVVADRQVKVQTLHADGAHVEMTLDGPGTTVALGMTPTRVPALLTPVCVLLWTPPTPKDT